MRENLEIFKREVDNNFRFLIEEYGFVFLGFETSVSGVSGRYETSKVFIEFCYAPPGFEIDIYLGEKIRGGSMQEASFSLLEICEAEGIKVNFGNMACLEENLLKVVPNFAQLFLKIPQRYLNGEAEAFEELASYRSLQVDEYSKKQEYNFAREKAAKAWNEKSYSDVIKFLEPHVEMLAGSEHKKLQMAKKMLKA